MFLSDTPPKPLLLGILFLYLTTKKLYIFTKINKIDYVFW